MEHIELRNIENMTKKQLKEAAKGCFEYAPEAAPVDRLAILQEAQFYTRELERRNDSFTSIRDLILELVVIGLIGWEIYMSYRAERQQRVNFKEEQGIFENLQKSSDATKDSLTSVKDILGAMELSLEKQVELFYDVQINVVYNEPTKRLAIINNGRSNITVWAQRVAEKTASMTEYPKTALVPPGGTYEIPLEEGLQRVMAVLPKGQSYNYWFTFFVKNEKKERFTVSGDLVASWHGDTVSLNIPSTSIVPGWTEK